MQFIPLELINRLWTGKNQYTKTPNIFQRAQILTGHPDFLNSDMWDAYEIFISTPQLYSVITRRGYLLSSGSWKHYRIGKNGKPELIENSKVVALLENPNPLINGNDLIRQWNENKCIYGNNYEFVNRPFSSADPRVLHNLPAAQIEIETTGKWYKQNDINDIILNYKLVQESAVTDIFKPEEINHSIWATSRNPIKGESPMKSLFMPISNIRAAYGFRNVILTKKGALGILSNNAKDSSGAIPLNATERERLEAEYQRAYGLGDEQSKIIMSNSSLNWQPMTYPTKDLMLFEEVDDNFRSIIDNYGLNINIFSRDKGATFENLAEGLKQAYQSTIIPEAEELAMNRTRLFNLASKGEWLELDYSHIPVLQENMKDKSEVLERKARALSLLIESGLYSSNELRDIISFE